MRRFKKGMAVALAMSMVVSSSWVPARSVKAAAENDAASSTDADAIPSAGADVAPSADVDATPSAGADVTPSADVDATPSADVDASPSAGADATPSADVAASPEPSTDVAVSPAPGADVFNPTEHGYTMKWQDEFEGDKLNRDDWNVELHETGWVNAELQEYVDSEDNIYLEDGKLEIKPIQTKNADGTYSYTSGRISTMGKKDFTYGFFEAKVKVPEGKGYLPAFWMMPDENIYGQWPRCGEIDIMEVMGQETNLAHNTIHYGNPHSQNQGDYKLPEGSFADSYHTFAVEWLPGELIWYIDGKETYRTSDWHSTTEGQGTLTYPAPFDQPFGVILNLAVGGDWVGYPDDATFQSQNYSVDYVRVYQKDSYDDSDVKKPIKDVVLRDPAADGNYVNNGNFADAEDLETEAKDWWFSTQSDAEATAEIKDNAIYITTTKEGTLDYSIQLLQANIPMKKGATYKVSYDAYADAPRKMMSKISAPDNGWAVYGGGDVVELTTEKKSYEYEFRMTSDDDANGRLEFNMGAYGSTAGIHISNVKIEQTAYEPIVEDTSKKILADGNYVYNGKFQEGDKHLGFWDITEGTDVSVTALSDNRRLKVVAPEGTSEQKPVVISQDGLALVDGNFALSFDVEGESGKTIDVNVAGVEKSVTLTGGKQSYNEKLSLKDTKSTNFVFTITAPGTYYLDNVRIVEDTLIKNGSFNAGFAGYEPFADTSADATWVVDSMSEDNAADFTINNTGDQDWMIQLKQNNVELEKNQWYKLTLDVKSSKDRKFMYAIQRDGNKHNNDWTPYVQETVDITSSWKTFTSEFQMTEDTDLESVLSLSMGAVDEVQITDQHRICIDNINLEKIDGPTQTEAPNVTNSPTPTAKPTAKPTAAPTLKVEKKSVTLGENEKVTVKATTNQASVKATSSNTKIVTVKVSKKNITLTGKKDGAAKVTVKAGTKSATINVTVKKAPTKIKVSNITVKRGASKSTNVKYIPSKAATTITVTNAKTLKKKKITVTVANGKITVKVDKKAKKGTYTVNLKTYNNKKASFKVKVN